jgi:hypothetical protein
MRKTAEKEERERNSDSRLAIGAPGISPGIRVAHNLTPNSYSSLHDRMELDRLEKEKRDREMAELRDRENRYRYPVAVSTTGNTYTHSCHERMFTDSAGVPCRYLTNR